MILPFVLVSALAVFGVSCKPMLNQCFQPNSYSIINSGYGSSLPVVNSHIRTSVVENPSVQIPSYPMSTSVSDSCHCLKTVVRPQIRNEIISVPTVDRLVRTVSNPVVETVNYGGNRRMDVHNHGNTVMSGNYNGGRNMILTQGSNGATFTTFQQPMTGFSNSNVMTRPVVATLSSTSATFPQSTTILSGNGGSITTY